ncbi:E4 [Gammapapillomavirus 19]|uniref:E4 n=1 Tax=Gammapapillomavirus 19 TaxID=1513264 RepID=A0A2D2ALX8_9PAPI|nr:E4 [Gammapapillomavirus 19]
MIQIRLYLIHVGNGFITWTQMIHGKRVKEKQITMAFIMRNTMEIEHTLQYLILMLSNMDNLDNGPYDIKIK